MVILSDQPEQWDRIRRESPLAVLLVVEGLRVASPNQGLFRIVMEDTEIAGTEPGRIDDLGDVRLGQPGRETFRNLTC